jgi:glycosyltransferase involved in cell wall biosynthesis
VKEHSIVHFFLQSCSSIEPVIVAKLFGRKVIVDSRSSYKGNKRLTRMLDSINKKLLPFFVDERLAISQDSGITMFRKKNFKIVNSAIDSERYKFNNTTRNKYREELGLKDEIIVGHVGRFTYEKNHAFLLEVFLNIISKNKNFKLVLVGDGPYKLDIIQKVKSLELENKVIFLGLRDDIPEILQMMDIFVFPSHFEGLGRVVIESQAAGLLTFVSDTVPNEVYITDIVKRISLDEPAEIWANEILKTINNKGSYQRTDKIDCVIKNGFDIRNTIDILISIYEKLVFHSRKGE